MARNFKPRNLLMVVVALVVVLGVGGYIHSHPKKVAPKPQYPEYLNFGGNYVFAVPKNYNVDEQTVPGVQLVYTGSLSIKTLSDVYSQNGIAVQAMTDLTTQGGKAFKDYVNTTLVPALKKNLSTSDVTVKFGKVNGYDVARATVTKNSQALQFYYYKSGLHPVSVVAKNESTTLKTIEQTMTDVEMSDLKNDATTIENAIKSSVQLAKDQNATVLYNQADPILRAKNSQTDVTNTLKSAATFLNENVTISGGSYNAGEFSAALRFTPLNNSNGQPAFGSLTLKKSGGQWRLEQLTLPTPAAKQ